MILLYDAVFLVLAVLLQIVCGGVFFIPFPFAICGLLVIAMKYSDITAVVLAALCGTVIDFVCGREFSADGISFPLAVAAGALLLPKNPLRFLFGDYILPAVVAVVTSGMLSVITPLFFGESWFYLAGNSCDVVLSTVLSAGIFPLIVWMNDRAARKLDLPGIFVRTIKFALRPARRQP